MVAALVAWHASSCTPALQVQQQQQPQVQQVQQQVQPQQPYYVQQQQQVQPRSIPRAPCVRFTCMSCSKNIYSSSSSSRHGGGHTLLCLLQLLLQALGQVTHLALLLGRAPHSMAVTRDHPVRDL
jgi:hypothetical protein